MATVYMHNGRIDLRDGDGEKHFCAGLIKHLSGSLKQTNYKHLLNFVESCYGNRWLTAPLSRRRQRLRFFNFQPLSLIKLRDAQRLIPSHSGPSSQLRAWLLHGFWACSASPQAAQQCALPKSHARGRFVWKAREAREITNHPSIMKK